MIVEGGGGNVGVWHLAYCIVKECCCHGGNGNVVNDCRQAATLGRLEAAWPELGGADPAEIARLLRNETAGLLDGLKAALRWRR